MSIYKKILEVQKAVKTIKKNGHNKFHKYDYATEADVLEVKQIMNDAGLIAYPSVVGHEVIQRGENLQIIETVEYTIVDVDTGESVTARTLGAGEDKGDKGAYKAHTGASKYFLLKFFGVPTGDDPENDEQEKPRAKAPANTVTLNPQEKQVKKDGQSIKQMMDSIKALKEQNNIDNETFYKVTGLRGISGTSNQLHDAMVKLGQYVISQPMGAAV